MKYFTNFPKLAIYDNNNNYTLATNLLARVNLIPSLLNNPALYYLYDYQESDTPEIIATKYYDNPYRYWIFLYGNNIMDPQWDLPLPSKNFELYLESKYKEAANGQNVIEYTKSEVKYYQHTYSTYDSLTQTTTNMELIVDYETYANLPSNIVTTRSFPSGETVTVTEGKKELSIYDYESLENEKKRNVKVIDKKYAGQMENKLRSLMNP